MNFEIMKKLFFFVLVLCYPIMVYSYSDEAVCFFLNNGSKKYFLLQDRPKVLLKENDVEIYTNAEKLICPYDEFSKWAFEKINTTSIASTQDSFFVIDGSIIKSNEKIEIYDLQGNLLYHSVSGEVDLRLAPKGLYIVKSKDIAFKYQKR